MKTGGSLTVVQYFAPQHSTQAHRRDHSTAVDHKHARLQSQWALTMRRASTAGAAPAGGGPLQTKVGVTVARATSGLKRSKPTHSSHAVLCLVFRRHMTDVHTQHKVLWHAGVPFRTTGSPYFA